MQSQFYPSTQLQRVMQVNNGIALYCLSRGSICVFTLYKVYLFIWRGIMFTECGEGKSALPCVVVGITDETSSLFSQKKGLIQQEHGDWI